MPRKHLLVFIQVRPQEYLRSGYQDQGCNAISHVVWSLT
jgi:hypothetical protein